MLLALAALGALGWSQRKNTSGEKKPIRGLARKRDTEPLLAKAMTAKARSLRPTLREAKHIAPRDTGVLLGDLQGTRHKVRIGREDVAVAINQHPVSLSPAHCYTSRRIGAEALPVMGQVLFSV